MAGQRQSETVPGRPAPRAPASRRAVVVGAGIGGLACAAELAASGFDVLVLERAASPGGKLREVVVDGRPIDAGPTVFTMRWVFEELFAACGSSLASALPLSRLETLARHAWSKHERLDLHADLERSVDAIAAFASPAEAARYRAFCARAAAIYRTLEAPFLRASRPTPLSLATRAGWRGLPGLLRISPFSTLHGELAGCFTDRRLVQLFGRYATYCGSSPYLAPATLMLVAHVEQEGVWSVDGGMKRIAEALLELVRHAGGRLRCDADVAEIVVSGGRAVGVRLAAGGSADGEFIAADAVVFNGDVAALGAGLLGTAASGAAPAVPREKRSLSAITWNGIGSSSGFPLHRHNVFFGNDYAAEFDAVLAQGHLPADPTVYVCAQDRLDGSPASANGERFLCLVNAPARGDGAPLDRQEIARCRLQMDSVLERCGLRLELDPARTVTTTPSNFAALFPGSGGALYGRASHGWAASFSRPGARSKLPGPLPRGRHGAPGAGAADGGALGPAGGGQHPGRQPPGPRFDLVVAPGGYAWWYVDALSADGRRGLTLIAFLGSVFSPYYAWARRRDPQYRPAAACGDQRRPVRRRWPPLDDDRARRRPRAARRDDAGDRAEPPRVARWRLDDRHRRAQRALGGRRCEAASASCPGLSMTNASRSTLPAATCGCRSRRVPASRSIWPSLRAAGAGPATSIPTRARHRSKPTFAAGTGRARIPPMAAPPCSTTSSAATASRLGLAMRFRAASPVAEPVAAPPLVPLPASAWRIERATRSDAGQPPRIVRSLEDGPFYARSLVECSLAGEPALAMHESLDLSRFASPWVQAMLPFRMPRRG